MSEFTFLREAIEEYLKDHPTTYEQDLQAKLRRIREDIEYQETYFTPKLEDLKDGDPVEIQTSWGWQRGTWPGVLGMDTHINLWGGDTIESKFRMADLRKRYKPLPEPVYNDAPPLPKPLENLEMWEGPLSVGVWCQLDKHYKPVDFI